MKKFSRGKMSKMFNINKETLRYYSDVGILKADINPKNGYSEYSVQDVFLLSTILSARYLGMSISEIKEIVENSDINSYEVFIDKQSKSIENKIAYLTEIKETIDKNKSTIYSMKNFSNNFDFKSFESVEFEKILYEFDVEDVFECASNYKRFFDISDKEKIFISVNLEKENLFLNVEKILIESNYDNHKFIELFVENKIEFRKIELKSKAIKKKFVGTVTDIREYINKIIEVNNLDFKNIFVNKLINMPNIKDGQYFVEVYIVL